MPIVEYYDKNGKEIIVSKETPLPMDSGNLLTAFGEVVVAEKMPLVQLKFSYGLNSLQVKTQVNTSSGGVTQSDSMAVVSTGAVGTSQAAMFSRSPAIYEPGVGIIDEFTALFSTPASGSSQVAGIGGVDDGFFFSYRDLVFGVDIVSAGARHVEKFVFTTGSSNTSNITITLDGEAQTVATVSGDTVFDVARAVQAAESDFAVLGDGWDVFSAGDTVEFVSFTAEPRAGTFSLGAGATGVAATLSVDLAGATATRTTVAQADWNKDPMDGTGPSQMTLAHTNLNVYAVQFQFLGAGVIRYFVEGDVSGCFILVHQVDYTNNNIVPSVRNPSLPSCLMVKNTSNTTDIIMKSGSVGIFSEGPVGNMGLPGGAGGAQTTVTTEEMVFAFHMPPVFNSIQNRIIAEPRLLSLSSDGTKDVTFKFYNNPVLAGSPVFADVNPGNSSVQSSSTAGVTIASGVSLLEFKLGKVDNRIIDMRLFGVNGIAGDTLVFTATSTNGTDVSASLTFEEFQ